MPGFLPLSPPVRHPLSCSAKRRRIALPSCFWPAVRAPIAAELAANPEDTAALARG